MICLQVCNGILPIDQLRNHAPVIEVSRHEASFPGNITFLDSDALDTCLQHEYYV